VAVRGRVVRGGGGSSSSSLGWSSSSPFGHGVVVAGHGGPWGVMWAGGGSWPAGPTVHSSDIDKRGKKKYSPLSCGPGRGGQGLS
jgi:hypothetical protein